MSLSKRDMILAISTTAVLVALVSWAIALPMIRAVEAAHSQGAKMQHKKADLDKLIGQRGSVQQQLDTLRSQLPRFKVDEQPSAQILSSVKKIADDQSLSLLRLDPTPEAAIGDLSEVAIDCTWEGTLDAIAHFLHAVQMQGAMLDIRQLNIQPAQQTTQAGRLRGNFKLYYAFMREKTDAAKSPATDPGTTNVAVVSAAAVATNAPVLELTTNAPPPIATVKTNAPPVVPKMPRLPKLPGMPRMPGQ